MFDRWSWRADLKLLGVETSSQFWRRKHEFCDIFLVSNMPEIWDQRCCDKSLRWTYVNYIGDDRSCVFLERLGMRYCQLFGFTLSCYFFRKKGELFGLEVCAESPVLWWNFVCCLHTLNRMNISWICAHKCITSIPKYDWITATHWFNVSSCLPWLFSGHGTDVSRSSKVPQWRFLVYNHSTCIKLI